MAIIQRRPASRTRLIEAEMLGRAQKAVLASADWLTAAQVASLAGLSDSNSSEQAARWRWEGRIYTVSLGEVDYFPGYGFDPGHGYRPLAALKAVIEVFKGGKGGWGLAFWFSLVNSFLGGRRPQDLLKAAPEYVLAAAKDELASIGHG